MAAALTERVRHVAERLFDNGDLQEALNMIENDCTVEACHASDPSNFERVRLAALKLSDGETDRLLEAIVLAQTDYRDLLMAAGFGQPGVHLDWADDLIGAQSD